MGAILFVAAFITCNYELRITIVLNKFASIFKSQNHGPLKRNFF